MNWGRGSNLESLRACLPGPQPITPADESPSHRDGQCCRSTPTPHVLLQSTGPPRHPDPAQKKYLRQNEAAVGRPARWKAGAVSREGVYAGSDQTLGVVSNPEEGVKTHPRLSNPHPILPLNYWGRWVVPRTPGVCSGGPPRYLENLRAPTVCALPVLHKPLG